MCKQPLGPYVALRRKTLGLSQSDLASYLHYTNQAISSFESGETSPTLSVLPPLADFLRLSLDDLMQEKENPVPAPEKNPPFNAGVICANLSALRHSRGLSQGQEGEAIGVSRRTIINYEQGQSIPSLDALSKILSFYDISCSSFFYDSIPEPPEYLAKRARSPKTTLFGVFILGLLVGGGVSSAIFLPRFLNPSSNSSATSSAPYQFNSSMTSEDNSSGVTASSEAIPELKKLTIITTSGKGDQAGIVRGYTLNLTLFVEGTFDFTPVNKTVYPLSWSIDGFGEDVSQISWKDVEPYPVIQLSCPSTVKAGIVFRINAVVASSADPTRQVRATPIDITVYGPSSSI